MGAGISGGTQLWSLDGILSGEEPYGDLTTNVETVPTMTLQNCKGITSFRAPNLTSCPNGFLGGASSIKEAYFPKLTAMPGNFLNWDGALELLDLGACTSINSNGCFYGNIKFATLIIRTNSVCTISFGNTMTNTPIKNGTGTVYVPSALVSAYQQANGWSTCYNNGTQFVAIEGSQYE
jgi:hypothetical protein